MSALTAPPRNLAVVAAQKAGSAEVKIDNFSFGPATLTVPAGTTVSWTNRDDIPHSVMSSDDPRLFKSKVLDTDEKFSFTFTGDLSLLLLDPPENDRQGDRAMIAGLVVR